MLKIPNTMLEIYNKRWDRKKFALIGTALAIVLGGTVGYAVKSNQLYLAVISIIAVLILLRVARRRVEEVLVDERIERVSEKGIKKGTRIVQHLSCTVECIADRFRNECRLYSRIYRVCYPNTLLGLLRSVFEECRMKRFGDSKFP